MYYHDLLAPRIYTMKNAGYMVMYHCHPLLGMVSANAGPKGRYLADAIPNKGWQ